MTKENKGRVIVFILSLFVYLGLTSFTDLQEIITGVIVAIIVSLLVGKFLLSTESKGNAFKRFFYGIAYFFKFLWEMAKANLHVAYLVIHPQVPIKPGIVKIKTNLKDDTALTVLANSITLTPGTLTVDINPAEQELYIHWIDVISTDKEECSREIAGRFEKLLMEVFE
ncbi:MAG: Na+/H+ antiporter subunit E [Candidatus Marinimicrobia bacterium]|nr:Na+/H+ antiporter subunit E [Candidatus Neomarinimicrobiota bacterium]